MKVERINESTEVNITRTDILEFPNGGDNIVLNVEYKDGKLIAGNATNAGIIPEFEIEYDKDFDFDWNLDVLYNVIVKEHPEYLEMREMKGMEEMKETYREPVDQRAADELALYIDNDGQIYRNHTIPVVKNLARKKARGIYDKDLAIKAFEYVAKAGADKYKKAFGDTFNPATRHEAAKQLLDRYMEMIDDYVEHPEDLKESIIDKNNVGDQVMVDINKPGFLSKMEELRKNGYKRLWSGDGKVCFAKPKKMEKSIGLKEEVSNDAQLVAEKMIRAFDKMNKITMDDFDEQFALAIRSILGIDNVWDMSYDDTIKTDTGNTTISDFESDVRGILSYNGYTTELEGDNEGGLKRESLKEDYSETDIRRAIFKVHDIMEDTYTSVLADIVSRALDSDVEDVYDAVVTAVDEGLIYYNDEWAVIEHYTSPKDINDNTYSEAIENLIDDAVKVVEFIKKNNIDESLDKDIMVNQELNAPKESVESQCPAYAGAMKEMSKAQDKREKKVETDIKNVTNKDFSIENVEKYELDESLFN